MAPGPVAAGGTCNVIGRIGSAAAGFSKFQGGFALIAVAFSLFVLLVCFTAGAGVGGSGFLLVVGLCGFWHLFTNRTGVVR